MVAFSIRRQRSQGRRRPGAAPGKPSCGARPKPSSVKRSHISRDSSFSEISVMPILLDRSEEHMSELQSLMRISYAVFCLKKKQSYTVPTLYSTNTPPLLHSIYYY